MDDSWYEERSLRRAAESSCYGNSVRHISEIDEDSLSSLHEQIPDGVNPVLLFGSVSKSWTVFGSRGVASFHGGSVEVFRFKSGWKSIEFVLADDPDDDPDPRHRFEYLDVDGTKIWGARRFGVALLASLFQSIERSGQYGPDGIEVNRAE